MSTRPLLLQAFEKVREPATPASVTAGEALMVTLTRLRCKHQDVRGRRAQGRRSLRTATGTVWVVEGSPPLGDDEKFSSGLTKCMEYGPVFL